MILAEGALRTVEALCTVASWSSQKRLVAVFPSRALLAV